MAPKLVQRAAAAAGRRLHLVRDLARSLLGAIVSWRLDGDRVGDELDAIGIAGGIEEAVLSAAWTTPVRVAAPRARRGGPG